MRFSCFPHISAEPKNSYSFNAKLNLNMATIRPFSALRPASKLAAQVAALPYDVMNTDEARDMAAGNPYSFLHVSRAEIGSARSH
jgi:hypothetical protein